MIENDELKPISYEGQGLPTIEQYAQAVSSNTGAEESDDENDNESSGSDDDVISAEEDDDSDGDLCRILSVSLSIFSILTLCYLFKNYFQL